MAWVRSTPLRQGKLDRLSSGVAALSPQSVPRRTVTLDHAKLQQLLQALGRAQALLGRPALVGTPGPQGAKLQRHLAVPMLGMEGARLCGEFSERRVGRGRPEPRPKRFQTRSAVFGVAGLLGGLALLAPKLDASQGGAVRAYVLASEVMIALEAPRGAPRGARRRPW